MTDRDTENLTVPFEQAHGERRKIDIVQVAHLSAQKVGTLRLLHAHGNVGIGNIKGAINAICAVFALKAHIFVGKHALIIAAVLKGRLRAAYRVELFYKCRKFGHFCFIDIPDIWAEFVVPVRLVPFRAAFRAVIHARDPRHGVQNGIQRGEFALVRKCRIRADNIVIIDKIKQMLARIQAPLLAPEQAGERMFDLKKLSLLSAEVSPL